MATMASVSKVSTLCVLLVTVLSSSLVLAKDKTKNGIVVQRLQKTEPLNDPMISGLKVDTEVPESNHNNGLNVMKADVRTVVRVFGKNLDMNTLLALTASHGSRGQLCSNMPHDVTIQLSNIYSDVMATIELKLPETKSPKSICVKTNATDSQWYHQGSDPWLMIEAEGRLLPKGVQIVLTIFLLCLTGLFAGLNLGLMSLDKNELRVIATCGTETEKMHARVIQPLRERGNYLLCTILLSNVMINATVTVFLDQLTGSGLIAVITSTMSIVIFGDIVPQAICTRHGLAVGANTRYITYLFMLITFPVSYPVSKVLDWVLGEEIGQVYDRTKLMEFIRVTKDYSKLEADEVNMITGALNLKTKTAHEVMTRLEDVFMLNMNSILDFDTVSLIQKRGYSRIPVYNEERKNIVALFHAKDLAFVDPSDKMPLKTLITFYKHPLIFTNELTTLDIVLKDFKNGKSHLAFVQQFYQGDDEDPYYDVTGVVSLEDVIEEILQAEIVDETDILSDNRKKQKRKNNRQDFSEFSKIGEGLGNSATSPQMVLAAFQFLSSSVEPFSSHHMSEGILRRLMGQKIYFVHRVEEEEEGEDEKKSVLSLYTQGEPVDYFVLILEGRVRVTVGREKLVFISGPFSDFGTDAIRFDPSDDGQLQMEEFRPDYSVEVIETTTYIKISRSVYAQAYTSSRMEKRKNSSSVHSESDRTSTESSSMMNTDVQQAMGSSGVSNPSLSVEMMNITNNNVSRTDQVSESRVNIEDSDQK